MALFGGKNKQTSVALIDIDSSSVGTALATMEQNAPPTIHYSTRTYFEAATAEAVTPTMLQTLQNACAELVTQGSPVLRQAVGNGHVDSVLVSVGAPWQKTTVRTESYAKPKPFLFTRSIVSDLTRVPAEVPEGYVLSDDSVIATLLNGYEMTEPFGKHANRADLIILSSFIEKSLAANIEQIVRKTYHTHALTITAFAPVAYTSFRDLFAHEREFLVVHISGSATNIAFIKRGLLVAVTAGADGITELIQNVQGRQLGSKSVLPATLVDPSRNLQFASEVHQAETEWLTRIQALLSGIASSHALPRTVFLLAAPENRAYIARLLDAPEIRSLWLTDEPLRIVPITQSHFSAFVRVRTAGETDLFLMLLALYRTKHP